MQVLLNLKKVLVNRFFDYKSKKREKSNVFFKVMDLVIKNILHYTLVLKSLKKQNV